MWALIVLCPLQGYSQRLHSREKHIEYQINHWGTDQGLPANTLVHLYQDHEGFLWIGSFDGLIRFDGSEFITYNKVNTPTLNSNHARVLKGDSQGNLWLGTGNGLAVYKKGKFTSLADSAHTFFIESLFVDEKNHRIWIGTRDAGIFSYSTDTGKYEALAADNKKDLIASLAIDGANNLWIGGEKTGLSRFSNGTWKHYTEADGLTSNEILCIYTDSQKDQMLVGTTSGLFLRNGESFELYPDFKGIRINQVKKDPDGLLWVLTANGIYKQLGPQKWQRIHKETGLSNNDARDVFFDSENCIWIATYRGGLNQIRETKFTTFFAGNGLDVEAVGALRELDDNTFLVGATDGNLFLIEDGIVKPFQTKTRLTQRIYHILRDTFGNLWISSYDGLLLIRPDGSEKLFTEKDGLPTNQIRLAYQDRRGNYWIGTRSGGISRMKLSRGSLPSFSAFKFQELQEINSTFVMSIDEDAAGNLLVGSNTGGLNIIAPDGTIRNYSKDHGLISNIIFNAHADKDQDRVTWIATSDGLARLESGKVFNYTRAEGLPQESIFDVVEDNSGYLWMPMARGLIRVPKKQLDDFRHGNAARIDWKVYDKNGDLKISECTGGTAMMKASDGRLWFPLLGGLVSVDPSSLTLNEKKPDVYIERVTIDDRETDIYDRIVVPPGSQRVVIKYIAISLRYPGSTRYRYRLENFDNHWRDAATNEEAVYTSLPPGSYTFHAVASNNDGVWNDRGAAISFVVEPVFYQTWWFYTGMTLLLCAAVLTYIRLRTRAIQQRAQMLERKIEERTRLVASQRDELMELNRRLQSSQEEIMAQRDSLASKNEEIESINANLERIVAARTLVLEEQNRRLAEYSFINAHKLRAPLASILGLINLFRIDAITEEQRQMLHHLNKSAAELDDIVRSINRLLEQEFEKTADEEEAVKVISDGGERDL